MQLRRRSTTESTSLKEAKMSREDRQRESGGKTREMLQGSLKHVRAAALAVAVAAALAVALVLVASVPVSRAAAKTQQCECDPEGTPPFCVPCPGESPVPDPCDFVTGGGFVFKDTGASANHGSHGGCKHGAFWGHVNYVDHGGFLGETPYHVRSTEITGYLFDPLVPNARDICGFARTNAGEMGIRFRVRMVDNGEPGILDLYGIRLSNGYHVSTRPIGDGGPGGGNLQLHKPNPSSTAPDPPPTEIEMCGDLVAP
jgi:hypothetical protein